MTTLITDRHLERSLLRRRRAWGADKYDEVWNGVYIMNAMPNIEHQGLVGRLTHIVQFLVDDRQLGMTLPGCNVTDRAEKWRENYRVPDVAVFLNGTQAINKKSHWLGGPDLAVEIVSPRDRSREKLDFYAKDGTRELLLVDRDPWSLELYRLAEGKLVLLGRSMVEQPGVVQTEVVPLAWRLVAGAERPMIEVSQRDGSQQWLA